MAKLATGAIAVLLMTCSPVLAASVVENFDGENGGASALNYNGFSRLDVSSGSVDLIRSGDYGINCAGGSGSCVDLDGTTNIGGIVTSKSVLSFNTGDRVTLRFEVSGNQRGGSLDDFFGGFTLSSAMQINHVTTGGAFGDFDYGSFYTDQPSVSGYRSSMDPFEVYSYSFTATQSGSAFGFVGTNSFDSVGPVLDNFSFSVTAIPEPATWAYMVLGMSIIGMAMRSRTKLSPLVI